MGLAVSISTFFCSRRGYPGHAETDRLYTPFRDAVWKHGAASIEYAATVPLAFTIDGDGVTLFEQVKSPETWSAVVERRARKQASAKP